MTNRKINEAGISPLLAYLLGLTGLVIFSEFVFLKTEFAKHLIVLIAIGLLFKLSVKNREDFLLSTYGDSIKRRIRIIENLILCLPFIFILVFKYLFLEASILFLCSFIFALISISSNSSFTIPTPFSKRPFEFSVGFRKSWLLFPLAYSLTFIALKVDNINLGIASMILVFLTTLSFYSKPEHEYYVWVHSERPKRFLLNKILDATKNALLLVAPILIGLLLFYTAHAGLIILFFLTGLSFLWMMILAKYSVYPEEINILEGIIITVCLCFPPILVAVIPFFYWKSIKKLKKILDA